MKVCFDSDETSVGQLVVIGEWPSIWSIRIGWGHDDELPLSPWPDWHRKTTDGGWEDLCLAWCGLYVGFTWG